MTIPDSYFKQSISCYFSSLLPSQLYKTNVWIQIFNVKSLKFSQHSRTGFTQLYICKWMFHFLPSIFQFLSLCHWLMIIRNFCHKLQPITIMIIHISWGKSRIWSEQQIRSNSRLQNIAWTLQFLRQLSGRCRKPHIEWHDPIKTQRLRFYGSKLCNVRRLNSQP